MRFIPLLYHLPTYNTLIYNLCDFRAVKFKFRLVIQTITSVRQSIVIRINKEKNNDYL